MQTHHPKLNPLNSEVTHSATLIHYGSPNSPTPNSYTSHASHVPLVSQLHTSPTPHYTVTCSN